MKHRGEKRWRELVDGKMKKYRRKKDGRRN
jgi:hypothetical protein